MGILKLIAVGIVLGADAFTISSTRGFDMEHVYLRNVLRIAVFFGGFQALMPMIGFL